MVKVVWNKPVPSFNPAGRPIKGQRGWRVARYTTDRIDQLTYTAMMIRIKRYPALGKCYRVWPGLQRRSLG